MLPDEILSLKIVNGKDETCTVDVSRGQSFDSLSVTLVSHTGQIVDAEEINCFDLASWINTRKDW